MQRRDTMGFSVITIVVALLVVCLLVVLLYKKSRS
jgi:hypothetical protein